MKYSLDFHIIASKAVLDSFAVEFPLATDSKLWQDVHGKEVSRSVDEWGNLVLSGHLRFENLLDAQTLRDKLNAKVSPALKTQLKAAGSWIKLHDCNHDIDPPKSCIVKWEW